MPTPPLPPREPRRREHHGDVLLDAYAWLADRDDPRVLAHLRAENEHAEAVAARLAPLRDAVFEEIRSRTQETDLSAPVLRGEWWYYRRTVAGRQYPLWCRAPWTAGLPAPAIDAEAPAPGEQLLLDGNAEVGDGGHFGLGALEVNVGGDLLAYAVDLAGDERFTVRVRRIETGEVLDEAVTGAGYGLVWSLDAHHLFYTRVDDAWRPHQVWRRRLGAAPESDQLVFAEADERFWVGIGASRDDTLMVIAAGSKTTSEAWLLDLAEPESAPVVVAARREGVEYDVEPAGDRLLVTHNTDRADFEVSWAPLTTPLASGSAQDWRPWLRPQRGERVVGVDAFAGHAVVSWRRDGLTALAVAPRQESAPAGYGVPWDVVFDEPLHTVSTGENPQWQADRIQVGYESFLTPPTVLELDLATGGQRVLKRQPVPGYDPGRYRQERDWAQAPDGTAVPLSVVRDAGVPRDGTAPAVLYGYGAYEASMDPWFSVARLSLLDRGVVFAVAHVRGGGELGRSWYEQGRLSAKPNSFTDLVACARRLTETGWAHPARLGLEGGSAGGLLVGAALNLAPELFAVVHADVPFVDPLTTILDPSLPLTVTEWEEWGNPLADPAAYAVMKGYAPYENVAAVDYPAILATSSVNDTRVFVTEPAKWVAVLRERATHDQAVRPILLRVEMEAGHGGKSGRYDAWRQRAWELAFVLDQLGAGDAPEGPTPA